MNGSHQFSQKLMCALELNEREFCLSKEWHAYRSSNDCRLNWSLFSTSHIFHVIRQLECVCIVSFTYCRSWIVIYMLAEKTWRDFRVYIIHKNQFKIFILVSVQQPPT